MTRPEQGASRTAPRLRGVLLRTQLAALALSLLAFGLLADHVARARLEEALFLRLTAVAASAAAPLSSTSAGERLLRLTPDTVRSRATFVESLRAVQEATGVARIRAIDPGLQTLVDTRDDAFGLDAWDLHADRVEIERVLHGGQAARSVLFRAGDGMPVLHGYAGIVVEGRVAAVLCVTGEASFLDQVRGLRWALVGSGLLVLLVLTLVTARTTARLAGPLRTLARHADLLREGRWEQPVAPDGAELLFDEADRLRRALESLRLAMLRRQEDHDMVVAGIAHELRNPLAGLRLQVELMEDGLDDGVRAGAGWQGLRQDIARMERVVQDFLTWARRPVCRPGPVDPRAWLEARAAGWAALGRARGVLVTTEADVAREGSVVLWDTEMLQGVLHNLVANAIEASVRGQTVTVGLSVSGDGARWTVQDQGKGMDEAACEAAWRPFWTRRADGTGLGLPMVRRHVEAMQGSVRLRSCPGAGTTVEVLLPARGVDSALNREYGGLPSSEGPEDGPTMIG